MELFNATFITTLAVVSGTITALACIVLPLAVIGNFMGRKGAHGLEPHSATAGDDAGSGDDGGISPRIPVGGRRRPARG